MSKAHNAAMTAAGRKRTDRVPTSVYRAKRKAYDLELFRMAPDKRVYATAQRIVVMSDLQIPFEDPAAVEQALSVLDSVQPDMVVLNGDIVDCYAESVYLKDWRKANASIPESHRRARALMERLEHVPQKIWMGGNHEDRWRRILWSGAPNVVTRNLLASFEESMGERIDLGDPVASFAQLYDMPKYGFQYYPYSHRLYVAEGNLIITHGKYVSRHSGQSAKRTFEWLGRSCIVGHTHRLGTYLVTQDGREHGAWENGCLCQLEPDWDDAPNWQQGLSIVNIKGPEFHVIQVPIIRRESKPVAVYMEAA